MSLIEQEIEIFASHLREPYLGRWPFRQNNAGEGQIVLAGGPLSATNQTTSASAHIGGQTGQAAPASKPEIK